MRRSAVALVARRELTERVRERSFMVGTGLSVAIVALVVVLPGALGFGGDDTFKVGTSDRQGAAVAEAAERSAGAFDAKLEIREIQAGEADAALRDGDVDVVLTGGTMRSNGAPDDKLVDLLQTASREARTVGALRAAGLEDAELQDALAPPPLRVSTIEAVDEQRDRLQGVAIFTVLLLYGQLLTYGYWVASGVVEEKASRVVEVLLATIRPRELLAGKVIGLGLLGLGQLLIIAALGLVIAAASGAVEVDGAVLAAAAMSLVWFVLGYAFYASAFAVAGALVPRLEELQSSTTPLTLIIVISLFVSFGVSADPDGTLAHVTAFIPFTAPMTLPPRILVGEASTVEIVGGALVTIAATAALIPLAARIYEGAVMKTGSSIKLREAWRAAARA